MEFQDNFGPGVGLFPKDVYATVWNRGGATAVVVGDLMMFDMTHSDVDEPTASQLLGNSGSILGNVMDPPATIAAGGGALNGTGNTAPFFFAVVTDLLDGAGADNTKIKVQISGVVRVRCVATAITAGLALAPALSGTASRSISPVVGVSNRIIGIGFEPNGSAAGVYKVIFDGINGFGSAFAN